LHGRIIPLSRLSGVDQVGDSNPAKPLFIVYVLGYSCNPTYTATGA